MRGEKPIGDDDYSGLKPDQVEAGTKEPNAAADPSQKPPNPRRPEPAPEQHLTGSMRGRKRTGYGDYSGSKSDKVDVAGTKPPEPALQQHLDEWLGVAVGHFTKKPQAAVPQVGGRIDPLRGRDLRIEFVDGSLDGVPNTLLEKAPVVRVTAGGRPVFKAEVEIEVSNGRLEDDATVVTMRTDANGILRISGWMLGEQPRQTIRARIGSRVAEHTVRVSQGSTKKPSY